MINKCPEEVSWLYLYSVLAVFRGDLRRGLAFSCFSNALAIFQLRAAEIKSNGAKMTPTYVRKVTGSDMTHKRKELSIPSQVSGSVFKGSNGSFFTSSFSIMVSLCFNLSVYQ